MKITVHIILYRLFLLPLMVITVVQPGSYGHPPASSTPALQHAARFPAEPAGEAMMWTPASSDVEQQRSAATPAGDSILIHTRQNSRSHKISLYPDAAQKAMFFQVRGSDGRVYQLYIFDLEGNIIRQLETRNKQTAVVQSMEKGIYLFDVFSDDDKIGNGQISIR